MQVLLVEDEHRMAEVLKRALKEEGHEVVLARNGTEGFEMAGCTSFDVILLDVMLPGMDGFAVARKLRERKNSTPILMLTARDATGDVVQGLDSGADDYLTKPFSIEVLLARLRAVSRRGAIPRPVCLQVGDVKLDPATHIVSRAGQTISLTPREYKLLELLMRNPGHTVSRQTILDSVWGFGTGVTENTIEVFMRQLRAKIDFTDIKLIQTVRGVGYAIGMGTQ